MVVIGLTGSFGTGKTFVASIFRSFGAKVIDADRIAHDVIRKPSPAYRKIVKAFGPDVLGPEGGIDRKALGAVVFSDKNALKKLNRIVHPEVTRRIKTGIRKADKDAIVVVDAPLLIEAGLLNIVDKLVVVTCSKKRQISRCRRKFRIGEKEVLKRIRSQMSMRSKLRAADFVLRNDSPKPSMRSRVRKVWEEIVWR